MRAAIHLWVFALAAACGAPGRVGSVTPTSADGLGTEASPVASVSVVAATDTTGAAASGDRDSATYTTADETTDVSTEPRVIPDAGIGAAEAASTDTDPDRGVGVGDMSGDVAIVGTEAGLLAISLGGGSARALTDAAVAWCVVDDRTRVVWLGGPTTENAGVYTYSVAFYDLELGGSPRVVVRGVPSDADERIIDYGAAGRIGGADPVSFRVALRLDLSGVPTVGPEIGCDGDGAWYCYGDGPWPDDTWPPPLLPELEAVRQAVAALSVLDVDALARVVDRGRARPLLSSSPALEPRRRVRAVDRARCVEVPENCGTSSALPGGRYWVVVTDNDRGDFFYESRQLYDSEAREFVRSDDPRVRSRAPFEADSVEGMHVSPSGRGAVHGDRVVDFEAGIVWQSEGATACGWLGGGVRLGGPRG